MPSTISNINTTYIGKKGAHAQVCRTRSNHWHWECIEGREFNCAVKSNTPDGMCVKLTEVGGRSLECSCIVPLQLFWNLFAEVRS